MSLPWLQLHQRLLLAANGVGALALGGAHLGAAGADELADQIVWLSLAAVTLALTGAANACWLLAGRRAVGRRRHELLPAAPRPPVAASTGRLPASALVHVPGTARAHRPDCLLVAGKATDRATRRHAPCEVCGASGGG